MKRGRSGPVTPLQERQLGLIYSAAFGLSSVASDVIELARGGDRLVDLERSPFRWPISSNRFATSCSRSPRKRDWRSVWFCERSREWGIPSR